MSNEYTKQDIERMRMHMEQEHENALQRIKRKCKEEPLVPAGTAVKKKKKNRKHTRERERGKEANLKNLPC